MRDIPWNLCTTFAAIGLAIAYAILFGIFGFHPLLIPSALACLVTVYWISTALGRVMLSVQLYRYLIHSLIIGCGVAIATLIAGAAAIALAMFATDLIRELINVPAGQPVWNVLEEIVPNKAEDLIAKPMLAALLFGIWPATFLGLVYGFLFHARFDEKQARPTRKWELAGASGGTLIIVALLFIVVMQASVRTPLLSPGQLMAIRECGEMSLSMGVLAYCRGSPCHQGECQWDLNQDAFAIYVEPPAGSDWRWAGGGLGTGRRPDKIEHGIHWVKLEPNGDLSESSPRRYVRYRLQFEGSVIKVGNQQFRFNPGMLLVIQFSDDWAFTAAVGRGALTFTNETVEHLQSVLDQSCESNITCETAFRIRPDPAQGSETLP